MRKRYFNVLALILLLSCIGNVQGQTIAYYPKGDPDKWNVEIKPLDGGVSIAELYADKNNYSS